LSLLLLPLLFPFSYEISLDNFSNPHWDEKAKGLCHGERYGVPDMNCYIYRIYLFPVKVEVRSRDPPLVILKHFIPRKLIWKFMAEIKKRGLVQQKVVDSVTGKQMASPGRNANGTRLGHHETPTSSKIFNLIQQRIAAIDFRRAETYMYLYSLEVLSYNPGGHYAPHYDFMVKESEIDKIVGNRFLTFLFILQTAKKGGGTVFPLLHSTIQPEKGDAIMWLNMDTMLSVENKSFHAACPILEGTKMAATLWVRQRGQELTMPCHHSGSYDLESLFHPSEKKLSHKMD
ncbi:hypothetical protein PENTCL1PPCAC_6892, partial [Pristionchus entomophagus]